MNQVNIIGALVKDPELRTITTRNNAERSVLETRIAVRRPGGKDAPRDFFSVTIYGSAAETVAKYSGKGKRIGVTGRLKLEEWGDGEDRKSRVLIEASDVTIVDWPERSADEAQAPAEEAPIAA